MPSENARAVANDVIAAVGKGRKVSIRKIARNRGYSPSVADNPKKITKTKTYRETLAPVLDRYERLRDRILKAIEGKDLSKERFKDLGEELAKVTHAIQLLSGGATANVALHAVISEEKREMSKQALRGFLNGKNAGGDSE